MDQENKSEVVNKPPVNPPKVFISYSWTTPGHCDQIRQYAERLISDGIQVILDQWDLSEGQDKNAFMEKMVTDPSISHVLIFSDREYAQKADNRKAGVGTESQIISQKVYESVDQKKFIPIVCERDDKREPYLPVFLASRIWIDFSSPEAANENWENVLRALYGKPIHQKPILGKAPSYITEPASHTPVPTIGKFASLKNALENQKPTVAFCRSDFLDAIFAFADTFRIRHDPKVPHIDEKALDDLRALLPLRDQFIDWFLLETAIATDAELSNILDPFLERLLALRYRPSDTTAWNDTWFDAMRIFVYEVFLYLLSALIKNNRFITLHSLFASQYLLPDSERQDDYAFESFRGFWAYSDTMDRRKQRLKLNRISLIGDLVKERSTRPDIAFEEVMQAELLCFLMTLISGIRAWYPHTLVYSRRGGGRFPLFLRAAQHKHFIKLQAITGVVSADDLRQKYIKGYEDNKVSQWSDMIFFGNVMFDRLLNITALDTIQ